MKWAFLLAACGGLPFLCAGPLGAFQLPAGVPVLAHAGAAPPDEASLPRPLLRVDTALVVIPVAVTNALGAPVMGLDRSRFRIFENGVEQRTAEFDTDDVPVSIGLVLDCSGSMRRKWGSALAAAASFFRTSGAEDEFLLVEFNDRARLVHAFTPGAGEIYAAIARTRPNGRTSLIDAVYLAVAKMKSARHARKALVVLSDGGDNWSRRSFREMHNALVESDVQVYAMGIFDHDYEHGHPIEERDGPELLDTITALTGGRVYRVGSAADLPAISRRLGEELRSQYRLGYYSTDPRHDGKYRQVRVAMDGPGTAGLQIYYRPGYYSLSDP